MTPALIETEHLTKSFPTAGGWLGRGRGSVTRAVEDLSLSIDEGETLGLVGESGCGKSTTARLVARLLDADAGVIRFEGVDITRYGHQAMRAVRRDVQMIFQDPYASLNPRHTVGQIIGMPLRIHRITGDRKTRVQELMARVGLNPEHFNRYPHEFSGGQRQRVGIARALAVTPKLLICDEPVSALDVSIQAQILNLLEDLQVEFGLTYLFISHDLGVVRHVADRIAVMYLGRVVETGPSIEIFEAPTHPYTEALLAATPRDPLEIGGRTGPRAVLQGDVPSPTDPPGGCPFHPRCPRAREVARSEGVPSDCRTKLPPLSSVGVGRNVSACWFPLTGSPEGIGSIGAREQHGSER
jgi:oligopeptide/dipeptide ABC transporter ATP-binding protein